DDLLRLGAEDGEHGRRVGSSGCVGGTLPRLFGSFERLLGRHLVGNRGQRHEEEQGGEQPPASAAAGGGRRFESWHDRSPVSAGGRTTRPPPAPAIAVA